MKSLTKIGILTVMLLLVGFTIVSSENTNSPKPVTNNEVTTVNEETDIASTSLISYIDQGTMTASWYGPKFNGKKTANGEVYNEAAYTAAHKKYSFGTLLKITNPKNNKSVIVRINDRGPYVKGRELDLSKASAIDLGITSHGVAKLKVEQISLKGVSFPVITLN